MLLENLFEKSVDRSIEGVIKADDNASLMQELDEYVITDEVGKRLDKFLDAYNSYAGANGVWISGFFGSGKSHLLKIMALLLENRTIDGTSALELFLKKPKCKGDEIFAGDLTRAVKIPSESILFNIDQKADVISKTELDALVAVFVKVFDEHCGYYGKQAYIAQFERELESDGLFGTFRDAFKANTGKDWEWGRTRAKRMASEIDAAYNSASGQSSQDILDKYRADYRLSIEDFAEQIKAYIDSKEANFRLNFFVDEVGQYVADNVKLMTNLQTVAESLATKCNGQAWVIVTAQEEMKTVVGEVGKQEGNDFTKIQARFKNRMKLTSQDVAEVIQHRLLHKKDEFVPALSDLYHAQENNFKTLFDFADGAQNYRNFKDREHFIQSYPFIPYQFALFQSAIQNLSTHSAFEGKHSSVGERSMLGVFQQVAIAIKGQKLGELATFDLMFEGIRTALKTAIQQSILKAEKHLDNQFAIRLLKALFLVKYVKEFKPTIRNLCVLMHSSFERDIPSLRTDVEEALNLLEIETYIQRSGELYEYLTDEEQDIEQEIKDTDVDSKAVADELEKLIYDGVLKTRKIRWDENGQDYPFSRRLDGNLTGREHELSINIISSFHDFAHEPGAQEKFKVDTVYKDELIVFLPQSERLVRDLLMYKRTEKYVAHETRTTQQESRARILSEKGTLNSERYTQLKTLCRKLVGNACFYVAGQELEFSGDDGQNKMVKGFYELIKHTYPNLKMLRGVQFSENQIPDILREAGQGLFGNDAALPEHEQEMLSFIQANNRGGVRTTVKSMLDKFESKPYGWSYAAVLCSLTYLCGRGKVEVRESTNLLDDSDLAKALRNTATHGNLILDPQVEYSQSQMRAVKEFYSDFFERMTSATEAKALAKEVQTAFAQLALELEKISALSAQYPFVRMLQPIVTELNELTPKPYTWFIGELINQEEKWFDHKDKIFDPIRKFIKGPQKQAFDEARQLLNAQKNNLGYIDANKHQLLESALLDPEIYKGNKVQQLRVDAEAIQQGLEAIIEQEKDKALISLNELKANMEGFEQFAKLTADQQQQLLTGFDSTATRIQSQSLVAVIRDDLRRFEDESYSELVKKLMVWSQPKPEPQPEPKSATPGATTPPKSEVKEPQPKPIETVQAKQIKVPFSKPWLESEQDVNDYTRRYKEALIDAIKQGKQVQL
tara:strand:- start:10022 stop:13570 length:3549 start_codon:yes stop_codon:yes gene_type:complete